MSRRGPRLGPPRCGVALPTPWGRRCRPVRRAAAQRDRGSRKRGALSPEAGLDAPGTLDHGTRLGLALVDAGRFLGVSASGIAKAAAKSERG